MSDLTLPEQCIENERQRHPELGKKHKRDGTSRRRLARPHNKLDCELKLYICKSVKDFLRGKGIQ
jgi:hypothetical protein